MIDGEGSGTNVVCLVATFDYSCLRESDRQLNISCIILRTLFRQSRRELHVPRFAPCIPKTVPTPSTELQVRRISPQGCPSVFYAVVLRSSFETPLQQTLFRHRISRFWVYLSSSMMANSHPECTPSRTFSSAVRSSPHTHHLRRTASAGFQSLRTKLARASLSAVRGRAWLDARW